jgi:hypothetical protein
MLNISHKQTKAYHPESNGAVKRLHRRLKDALRARVAATTWSEELPFVLLGLGAQPKEDTGLSPAQAVFSAQIVLPNEFLQNDELSIDNIVKKFSKTLHVSAPFLPRHNSSTKLPSELPAELLSAPLVWVCWGGLVPPLQPLYDGSYAVLHCHTMPVSPHRCGRPQGSRPGGLAATKRVLFSDPLVSSPSSSAPPRDGPGTVFLPGEEVFARPGLAAPSQPPQKRYPSCQRTPPQRLDL